MLFHGMEGYSPSQDAWALGGILGNVPDIQIPEVVLDSAHRVKVLMRAGRGGCAEMTGEGSLAQVSTA